jgi:hypothetical protein
MKQKKEVSAEQIYKRNLKTAKVLKNIAPYVFWFFIGFGILFLIFAIRYSIGNVDEIITLLDKGKYTGEELSQNYQYLIEKYGEWNIGYGGSGFTVTFVNIKNALFSGIMKSSIILSAISFVLAFVCGKWLCPTISQYIKDENQDMVNLTVLKGK